MNELGIAICGAIGVDIDDVRGVTLVSNVGELETVTVEHNVIKRNPLRFEVVTETWRPIKPSWRSRVWRSVRNWWAALDTELGASGHVGR